MPMLWQLKQISTQTNLNEPQLLPENWGPIFGLEGFKDRLNDLSWIGMPDKGWFQVGPAPEPSKEEIILKEINKIIDETNQYVLADNSSLTKGEIGDWIEYRLQVKNIPYQEEYPDKVFWPKRPDVE
jgi:hypothetical protein